MRWRDLVLENLGLKLAALLLALLIWCAVYSHLAGGGAWPFNLMPAAMQRDLGPQPVLVLALPNDQRNFTVEPPTVKVTVTGPEAVLRELGADDVQVFVRPPNLADVSAEMPVQVRTPKGVSLIKADPPTVRVRAQVRAQ
jgi:YbbR domain-containing protein